MPLLILLLLVAPLFGVAQTVTIPYTETKLDFPNPERGFYIPSETTTSNFTPLDAAKLAAYRTNQQKHGRASYAVYASLLFRYYILDQFTAKPLSAEFLQVLENDMQAVEKAGLKIILRFSYTNKVHANGCADNEGICPPYGDAPKEIVLQHIAQLKPVLQKHAAIIAVLQQGFIGIWGENYYTDYFGDASKNGVGRILDNNWLDRNEVLQALLDALPSDRMVQVRTPQMKQKFLYGPAAPTATPPSPAAGKNFGTPAARIGFHNDCFLASADDYGTFQDYGSTNSPQQPANALMRNYFREESRFVAVGGETCDDSFSPDNDCAPAGRAEEEMAAMHYSYLNTTYNTRVNNDWDSAGCMSSIKLKLGYRLVLQKAEFPQTAQAGAPLTFSINMVNRGYAAPFNPRRVQLVLRNSATGSIESLPCTTDIRTWLTGEIIMKENIVLPRQLVPGRYELFLHLPDAYPFLAARPEYCIRLANENCWEEKSGYNNLHHTLTITAP